MSSSTARRSIGIPAAIVAAVMFSTVPLLAPAPAAAQPHDWHGGHHPPPPHGWHGGGWHGSGWHGGGDNTGALVGGALLGLGVGAAIGALAAPPPVAYAPPPAYYYASPPPPAYYGYGY